jgi:hypothetical protein
MMISERTSGDTVAINDPAATTDDGATVVHEIVFSFTEEFCR